MDLSKRNDLNNQEKSINEMFASIRDNISKKEAGIQSVIETIRVKRQLIVNNLDVVNKIFKNHNIKLDDLGHLERREAIQLIVRIANQNEFLNYPEDKIILLNASKEIAIAYNEITLKTDELNNLIKDLATNYHVEEADYEDEVVVDLSSKRRLLKVKEKAKDPNYGYKICNSNDSLRSIAKEIYGDENYWDELYNENQEMLDEIIKGKSINEELSNAKFLNGVPLLYPKEFYQYFTRSV